MSPHNTEFRENLSSESHILVKRVNKFFFLLSTFTDRFGLNFV